MTIFINLVYIVRCIFYAIVTATELTNVNIDWNVFSENDILFFEGDDEINDLDNVPIKIINIPPEEDKQSIIGLHNGRLKNGFERQ